MRAFLDVYKREGLATFVASPSMEAAGIEPAFRGTSAPASTCVAGLFLTRRNLAVPRVAFAAAGPDRQGPTAANRTGSLAVAASDTTSPEGPVSGNREPDLATKPEPLRQSSRTRGYRFIRQPVQTAVQQLCV